MDYSKETAVKKLPIIGVIIAAVAALFIRKRKTAEEAQTPQPEDTSPPA
jgi:LPXTG-motif cell wall-anchored protein